MSHSTALKATLSLALAGATAHWLRLPDRMEEFASAFLRHRITELFEAELEMLKVDWSGPEVFCTAFSSSYKHDTKSCSKGQDPQVGTTDEVNPKLFRNHRKR